MPTAARWLSLSITQSDRLPRWFDPPPARTAAFSSDRSPGVVLRVSQMRAAPPRAAASANRRVSVATPDRWHRKLRAVRSPVRIGANGPSTRPMTAPGSTAAPSASCQRTSTSASSWANVSTAHAVPATTPAWRATNEATARASAGTSAALRSPSGVRSSASAACTAARTTWAGGSTGRRIPGSLPWRALRRWPLATAGQRSRRPRIPIPPAWPQSPFSPGWRQWPVRAKSVIALRSLSGARATTKRTSRSGSAAGWSVRVCEPLVSVRARAAALTATPRVARLCSSALATSVTGRDSLADRLGEGDPERRGVAEHAGVGGHRSLEPVASRGDRTSVGDAVARVGGSGGLQRPARDAARRRPARSAWRRLARAGPCRRRWPRRPAGRRPCPRAASWRPGGWRRGRRCRPPRRRPTARAATRRRRGR